MGIYAEPKGLAQQWRVESCQRQIYILKVEAQDKVAEISEMIKVNRMIANPNCILVKADWSQKELKILANF